MYKNCNLVHILLILFLFGFPEKKKKWKINNLYIFIYKIENIALFFNFFFDLKLRKQSFPLAKYVKLHLQVSLKFLPVILREEMQESQIMEVVQVGQIEGHSN
jgi:hypothetical protein